MHKKKLKQLLDEFTHLIIVPIFRMSSSEYQIRYIENATEYEYVIPEELLEDVYSACGRIQSDYFKHFFTNIEIELSYKLCHAITNIDDDNLYGTSAWKEIQQYAVELLIQWGYAMSDFDIENESLKNDNNFFRQPETFDNEP